jgi:hypothetical protein
MAAIGGCQLVSARYYARSAEGATYDEVHAIQDVFFSTPGDVYPGAGPLLRSLLDASTPASKTKAIAALQHWCIGQQFAPTH